MPSKKETEKKFYSDTASPKSSDRKAKTGKNTPKRKRDISLEDYVNGILRGDRVILSRAITLVESTLSEHNELAQKIIEQCLPYTGDSIRIGITGIPGVGKSTFIETLGIYLTQEEKRKVAVLAIDPTSQKTRGSILGDKTRMEKLSTDQNAFIRPSPTSGSLGGVARKTRETILLCEAAGFNTIIVETVGVGQSEITVHSMVDFFLLLLLAGAGDEIQGIKRGITEMAHGIAVTKADGDNKKKAERARREFKNALSLFPEDGSGWKPKVMTCSALNNEGIQDIWKMILKRQNMMIDNGTLEKQRKEQAKYWMHETIKHILKTRFYENKNVKKILSEIENQVVEQKITPFTAAQNLLDIYFDNLS